MSQSISFSKINKEVNYLTGFTREKPIEILHDNESYISLVLIGKTLLKENLEHFEFGFFVQNRFDQVISNYLKEIFKIRESIDFQTKTVWKNAEYAMNSNEIIAQTFSFVIEITEKILFNSIDFAYLFVTNDGLRCCLDFLNDDKFMLQNKHIKVDFSPQLNPLSISDYMTMLLTNLKSTYDESKQIWSNLNASDILLKIAKTNAATRLNSYFMLAFLLDDRQIEDLFEKNEMKMILNSFIQLISKASESFKLKDFNRSITEIYFKSIPVKCAVHLIERGDGIRCTLLEILECLLKLTVNDSIKVNIYFQGNFNNCLRNLLENGNLIETNYTLELLAQLTFNDDVIKNMNSSKEFEKIFETLIIQDSNKIGNKNDKLIHSNIRQVIEQIKWNLNTEKEKGKSKALPIDQSLVNQQHIMISYNSSSRELCLNIKRELESMGHKVWIDVNTISGSSLESMSNAVENSFCFLMCVTEKYRQSTPCQLEAKYALKQEKPIIPLIMQQDFENPKGWLGLLMSDKIFVNFTKYDFDECIKRLKNEIDSIKSGKKTNAKNENGSAANTLKSQSNLNHNTKNDSILDWSEERVKEWFLQNSLNCLIFEHFKPFSGKILKQLYDTKQVAPEYYFQPMKEIPNVEFRNIMSFGACLDDLFNIKLK